MLACRHFCVVAFHASSVTILSHKFFRDYFIFSIFFFFKFYAFTPGYVKLPPEKFAQKKQGEGSKDLPTEPKKLQLNSAEELYAEIRDKNFNAVGAALSKKAKIISAAFEVSLVLDTFLLFFPSLLTCGDHSVKFPSFQSGYFRGAT